MRWYNDRVKYGLRRVVFAGAAVSAAACAAILGIEDREGLLPGDEGGGGDGSAEASEAGEAGDGGAIDGDASADARVDAPYRCPDGGRVATCSACGGMFVLCPATGACVEECRDECDSGPVSCTKCDDDGGYTAVCSPDRTPAASCAPSSCECRDAAADCPLGNMVCMKDLCVTCGDLDTRDELCRIGNPGFKCKPADDGDPLKRYRCK